MASYEVSTPDTAKFEGSGGGVITFTYIITRSGDLSAPGSVQWNLVAAAPAPANLDDFEVDTATTGIALFDVGQATVELVFSVNSDVSPEPNEGFGIFLFNATGGDTISTAAAYSIIKDDDALHYLGTAGADVVDNSKFTQGTVGDMSQGGNDKVIGSPLDDTVLFGATFNSKDKFDGGAGYDRLVLEGDYASGISIVANTLQNVEEIDFVSGFNYTPTH